MARATSVGIATAHALEWVLAKMNIKAGKTIPDNALSVGKTASLT